jgi:putative membrane protein
LDLSFLPAVNAVLNATAAVLLVCGVRIVRRREVEETRRIAAHKRMMLAAFACSCVFLASYVTHYAWRVSVMHTAHTVFHAAAPIRIAYYLMLASHILLAMIVPVLAVRLIFLGLKRRDEKHRRLARWAYPIWLYVSVTGVLIFVVLTFFNAN